MPQQRKALDELELSEEERLQALEQMPRWQIDYEYWIGKNDYILRQLQQHQETTLIRDEGEDIEYEERHVVDAVFRFYDFNEPFTIEPPVIPVE